MAGQPQPSAFIPLDIRTVDQFGFVKQAAREAEREVVRLEREVEKALQAGKNVEPQLQAKLNMAREILQKNQDISRQYAMNENNFKEMKQVASLFRVYAGAQGLRRLARGEIDAEALTHLMASESMPRLLGKMGFLRAADFAKGLMPSAMLGLFAAEQIKKGFAERDRDTKAAQDIGAQIAAGKFSPEMIRVLDEYQGRWWEVWKWRLFGEAGADAAKRAEELSVAAEGALDARIKSSDFEKLARDAVLDTRWFLNLYEAEQADATKLIAAAEEVRRQMNAKPEMTDQELRMLAQDVFVKAELNSALVEKFTEKLLKHRKTAAAWDADLKRLKELNKTPAETYRELSDAHEKKTWANLRRYDMLRSMAQDAMFVRD